MKKVIMYCSQPKGNKYFGGVATIVKQYINSSSEFSKNNWGIDLFDTLDDKVHVETKGKLITLIKKSRKIIKVLKEEIKKEEPDVIHIHTSRNTVLLRDLLIARHIKKSWSGKVVFSLHRAEFKKILPPIMGTQKLYLYLLGTIPDKIIFLSKVTKDEFINKGIDKNKCELLYTFHNENFNEKELELKKSTIQSSTECTLSFLASINQQKGILDLLEACEGIKIPFSLNVCGTITEEKISNEYNYLCEKLQKNVKCLGYVSGQQKHDILLGSKILILPSYAEGMPVAIMEAMAAGCAIVTTPVGAIPEILKDGINAIFVKPGDVKSISRAITLLHENADLREKISLNNANLGKKYTLSSNIENLCQIYNTLI